MGGNNPSIPPITYLQNRWIMNKRLTTMLLVQFNEQLPTQLNGQWLNRSQ